MSETLRLFSHTARQTFDLNHEERTQLNTILDLLIPSDQDFPPPSSLHLLDDFLLQLRTTARHKTTTMLGERQLRSVLHELNVSAGGDFCQVDAEKQQRLLRNLEHHDPAFFQALWTLANHSYYKLLAIR